ncbi:MAG: tetratricopeptide repeat protein, partial [Opitutae bacterium]|nr:tetratricopeptide repeat protein [Opitutae bacterium]
MARPVYCISAFLLCSLPVTAQSNDLLEAFQAGNAAYAEEQYLEAVKAYEKAMDHSRESSLALLFNLGNAYYQLQDFPSALLAYERALTLDPGNPDVAANLQKVIEHSNLSRPDYSVAQEFAYSLSLRTWLRLLMMASAIT